MSDKSNNEKENSILFTDDYDSDDFLEVIEEDEEIVKDDKTFGFEVNGRILRGEEYDQYIKQMVADYHAGDEEKRQHACDEIIRSLNGLIASILNQKIDKSNQDYNDLFQEARIAILMDLDKYDPEKARLSTFFYKRIKHAIHQYLSEFVNESSIYMQKNVKLVKDKINEFEQMKIFNPTFTFTNEMIAEELNLSIEQVKNARAIITRQSGKINYIEEYSKDNGNKREEPRNKMKLAEEPDLLEDEVLAKERVAFIRKAIQQLNSEEQQVILYTFGFLNNQQFSKDDIAQKMGISKDMVIRIINRAKEKLKKTLSSTDMYSEYEQYIEKIIGDPLPLIPYDLANEMMDDIINSEIILNL